MRNIIKPEQEPVTQRINDPLFDDKGISVWLRREDLVHSQISGNKWWKLSGNLESVMDLKEKPVIVTFGGAYSNHIYSTAAACKELGLLSVGIIRGEINTPLNATLSFARECGMELIAVDRGAYRNKEELADSMQKRFGNVFIVPEGGTNAAGIKAVANLPDEELNRFDIISVPIGTGGTMAGIIGGVPDSVQVLGFSALKGDFLQMEVESLLKNVWPEKNFTNWKVEGSYHFGGYAKLDEMLVAFIQQFYHQHGILLDPVYTGKMMFGIYDMIRLGQFRPGTSICAIHTGGLQGWGGVSERYGIDPISF